tara:strand:+ start:42136 stop:42339 length:204 start_codon:yes stop_codon:yes gene_type:complete
MSTEKKFKDLMLIHTQLNGPFYTFQVLMFASKLVASLVIDSYSNRNFAEASPIFYDVGEIQYFNQPD